MPEKLLRPVTVMVEVPLEPARIWLGVTVLAATVKSTTWKTMFVERETGLPLIVAVPVTVTV